MVIKFRKAATLDKEISETEVLNVLKAMKNNKSPGSDGFTAEFYKLTCLYILSQCSSSVE